MVPLRGGERLAKQCTMRWSWNIWSAWLPRRCAFVLPLDRCNRYCWTSIFSENTARGRHTASPARTGRRTTNHEKHKTLEWKTNHHANHLSLVDTSFGRRVRGLI